MAMQNRPEVKNQRMPRVNPIRVRMRQGELALANKDEVALRPPEEISSENVGQLKGVYIISVAARLLEMHPQTLRKYERLGLVRPSRTIGMLRLYSEEDIEKLRLIRYLEENLGLNLAGVEFTLNLLGHLLDMLQKLRRMEEAEQFFGLVEQEMAQLFRRLNLPLQE